MAPHLPVSLGRSLSQLQHIRQHSDPPSLCLYGAQDIDPADHGVRACVISIVDHRYPVGLIALLAHGQRAIAFQRLCGVLRLDSRPLGGCNRRQGVIHHMNPKGRQKHRQAQLLMYQHKRSAGLPGLHLFCTVGAAFSQTIGHHREGGFALHRGQKRVVTVDEKKVLRAKAVGDVQLFMQDVFLRFQLPDMRKADVGHDRHGGVRHGRKAGHLAKLAHTHLYHSRLMLRLQLEQREGQANLAVLVALGTHGVISGRKSQRHHLFGGGLAHASGNAHYRDMEVGAVPRRRFLQGFPCILHQNPGMGIPLGCIVILGKCPRRSGGKGGFYINMGVGALPLDGDEQAPRLDAAAVCAERGDLGLRVAAKQPPAAGLCNLLRCKLHPVSVLSSCLVFCHFSLVRRSLVMRFSRSKSPE